MTEVPSDILGTLKQYDQEHLLFGWEELSHADRQELIRQLKQVRFAHLIDLFRNKDQSIVAIEETRIKPISMEHVKNIAATEVAMGQESLSNGEVAVLLVAGGQGTRLGFDKPKGMFPIGEISNKTLFQIHAEKVLALSQRYGKPIPFLIMTSPATHDDTIRYFEEMNYFGLPKSGVYFFQQGTLPALDLSTGKLLLEKKGVLFTSPNGHGGTLTALADSGLLGELKSRGIKHLFYFQVDNPLVCIADHRFLGQHIATRSQASSKAIAKAYPDEKMGVFTSVDGRCTIIEYSDMPKELKHATDANGKLIHRAGSPAIHFFDVDFLEEILQKGTGLPYHLAKKKVPCIDPQGNPIEPKTENALKFEMFIFDALPKADRWLVLESPRSEEFAPVKNADGVDSPATCKQALRNLYGTWLERIGIQVPRDDKNNVTIGLEISPLFSLNGDDLLGRIPSDLKFEKPMYWN